MRSSCAGSGSGGCWPRTRTGWAAAWSWERFSRPSCGERRRPRGSLSATSRGTRRCGGRGGRTRPGGWSISTSARETRAGGACGPKERRRWNATTGGLPGGGARLGRRGSARGVRTGDFPHRSRCARPFRRSLRAGVRAGVAGGGPGTVLEVRTGRKKGAAPDSSGASPLSRPVDRPHTSFCRMKQPNLQWNRLPAADPPGHRGLRNAGRVAARGSTLPPLTNRPRRQVPPGRSYPSASSGSGSTCGCHICTAGKVARNHLTAIRNSPRNMSPMSGVATEKAGSPSWCSEGNMSM